MKRIPLLVMAGLVVSGLAASAAYLESDVGRDSGQVEPDPPPRIIPPPPPVPPPPPPPRHGPALPGLVRQFAVGAPVTRSGLTVFPLRLRHGRRMGIVTLDEALRRDELAIREKGDGQVPWLLVRNDSRHPVFLLAGEIIVGGKQNRIVREDILLPPRSGWTEVSVYCGEQHRWRGGSAGFKSKGTLSAPSLRGMAARAATQDNIWREIEGQLDRAEVKSSTRSYQGFYESEAVRRKLDACVAAFPRFPDRGTVGCVIVSGRRILGCDVFFDPDLFARLWPKIIRSYAAEVVFTPRPEPRRHDHRIAPFPSAEMVRRFLDSVAAARFSERRTPGLGRAWRISGAVTGDDLEHNGEVVHAGLFSTHRWFRPIPLEGHSR